MRFTTSAGSHPVPDFLIVGAARSGTTSLYYDLRQHPRVFMPDRKEPFFLTFLDAPPEYEALSYLRDPDWTLADYGRLFAPARPDQLLGEASTSYLYLWERTIRNLEELYGDRTAELGIFAVLRDPVERTFSHYLMMLGRGWDDLSFDEFLDLELTRPRLAKRWDYDWAGFGSYSDAIRAYRARFPKLRVYLLEDLERDPLAVVNDVFETLGVEPLQRLESELRANAAGNSRRPAVTAVLDAAARIASPLRHWIPAGWRGRLAALRENTRGKLIERPEMTPAQRATLREFFRADVEDLASLLGRDLSGWLR